MSDDIFDGLEGGSSIEIGVSELTKDTEPEQRTLGFPFPNLSNDYNYVLSSGSGEYRIGSKGFYVYLNKRFAQRAFDLVLLREQYCQIRDGAKALSEKLGFEQTTKRSPFIHFPAHKDSKRGLISDISVDGISLLDVSLDRQDFRDIMNGKLERNPEYRTMGLTDSKRSLALQELWMFWINQMRAYGVSSSD